MSEIENENTENETPETPAEAPVSDDSAEQVADAEPAAEVEPMPEAEADPVAEPEPESEPAVEPGPAAEAEPVAEEAEAPPAEEAPAEETAPAAAAQPEPKRKRKRLPRPMRRQRTKAKRDPSAERKPIVREPKPEAERGRRQERRGVVVSSAMDKTIVVRVDQVKAHPKYKKIVRRTSKLHAHDEGNRAHVGDIVRIVETRPLSKTKRWRLAEIVEEAR